MAQLLGDKIDRHDGREDEQENSGYVGVIELADRNHELLPDPARADETHHRSGAHVDLEPQQRIRGKIGRDLGQDGKVDRLNSIGTGGGGALDRTHVDVFYDFGEELAERTYGMNGQRQHSRHGSQPERHHEQKRKHDLRDGAAELEESTAHEADGAARLEIGGGKEADQERAYRAEQGPEIRDQQGISEQLEPHIEVPEPLGDVRAEVGP